MILTPTKENIDFIIQELLKGKIIIFPTDTVFGIGCIATNTKSIEKIYELKERNKNKTLLLNFPNITNIKKFAILNKNEEKLLKEINKLTLIVKSKPNTSLSPYTIKEGKIGVRIPTNKILLKILKDIKTPIISTSCNKSGKQSCLTALSAEKIFGKDIIILKEEEKLSGTPSTIIEIKENKIKLIRQGDIFINEIKNTLEN